MKTVKNFSRFYALTRNIAGDREELKENLVRAFSNGRTTSLREMRPEEYKRMCDSLEQSQSSSLSQKEFTAEIKRKRSAVLKRLQQLGVNTADWAEVDEFCLNIRIAGKEFRHISLEELKGLIPKLEAIARKPKPEPVMDPAFYSRITELTRNQIPS